MAGRTKTPRPNTIHSGMVSAADHDRLLLEISAAWPQGYSEVDAHRDLNAVFLSSAEGRRVLYFLLDYCGMHRNPVDPEGKEHITYQNIGRADFGRFLIATLTTTPLPPASPAAQTEPETEDGR